MAAYIQSLERDVAVPLGRIRYPGNRDRIIVLTPRASPELFITDWFVIPVGVQ